MVMDGGHFKQPLAVGCPEIGNLNDVRHGFHNVYKARENQHQRNVQSKGKSADHAPQEQGAGIAHKRLGGMPVEFQKGQQAAHQGRRQDSRVHPVHGHGGKGEEQQHRNGHGAAQAVHAIGEVYGVDTAHDDKHTENTVDNGRNKISLPQEGNIQVAGQNAAHIQHIQEHAGDRRLQHGLLKRGQAHVPAILHLAEVIQKANHGKAGGQGKDKEGAVFLNPVQIADDAHKTAQNKHQAHHQGCTRLAVVPGGADGADGLASLQRPQHRQQKIAE